MIRRRLHERLSDPQAWRASTIAGDLLVTDIGLDEVDQLAAPGPARDAVEGFCDAHRVTAPALRGLVLFVVASDADAAGFIEVRPTDSGSYEWNGPHGPLGPLPTPRTPEQ